MGHLTSFLFGVTIGVYLAQNYDVPNVKNNYNYAMHTLKKYETKSFKKE